MRRAFVFVLFSAWAVASCAALPSAMPLGRGPGAGEPDEAHARARTARDAEARDPSEEDSAPTPEPATLQGSETAPAATDPEAESSASNPQPSASSGAPGMPTESWTGDYVGSDVFEQRVKGQLFQRLEDPNARTRVEAGKDKELLVTIVDSSTGEPMCTLTATLEGARATFVAGQTDCFSSITKPGGWLTLQGEELELELELSSPMQVEDDVIDIDSRYWFKGRR